MQENTEVMLAQCWGFIPLRHLLILRFCNFNRRMYIFKKESDAPARLWESNCIEQSSVWADLNEFRFILDIHNEVRVISWEETRADSPLSFLCASTFSPGALQIQKTGGVLHLCKASRGLPPSQLCLGSLSFQAPQGLMFPVEQTLQHSLSLKTKTASAPALLTSAPLISKPHKHQSLIKILSNVSCFYLVWLTAPSRFDFSLLEPLGNLCWHFHHRLWSGG